METPVVIETEAIVIGAGAVGLACAAALGRSGLETFVLEAAPGIGTGISSRNSEVIHSGIYYPTGSLRHLHCVDGRRLLYSHLARHGIDHKRTGKLVVATSVAEIPKIEAIFAQGVRNGVEGLTLLSGRDACTLEPSLVCEAAVQCDETGVFDSHAYMVSLQGIVESQGGAVTCGAPVIAGEILPDGRFSLRIGGNAPFHVVTRRLVNSAGLDAVHLARMLCGYDDSLLPDFTLAKGSYFSCQTKPAFTRLIYPAPVEGGLGVHITLDLAGRMRFGPDVEWLEHDDPSLVDYQVDIRRADGFYAAVRRYWPGLPDGAIHPDYSGCRPKLSRPGQPAADFRIDGPALHGHAGLVHLFGIESPGLTSSLSIADAVAMQVAAA